MSEIDKSYTAVLSDLLKATWLNLKNSEEVLLHNLKNIQNNSIEESINIFHNNLQDVDRINANIDNILKQIDNDMTEINEILIKNKSPKDIVSTDQIFKKFDWSRKQLERDVIHLKNIKGDLEDKLTVLQHENQEIHTEYRNYVTRMQPLDDERARMNEEMKDLKINFENNKEKLAISETSQQSMQKLIDSQVMEIEKLKSKIVTLETEMLEERMKSQSLIESYHDNKKKQFPFQRINKDLSLESEEKCSKCLKYLQKINNLLKDFEEINKRYSMKREKHRQQLIEARATFTANNQNLLDQNIQQKITTNDLLEKNRFFQLRFQTAIHEKVHLSKKVVLLENEIVNLTNNNVLYEEKIKKLESHIEKLIQKYYEKLVQNESENF